jgi:hypothetical protein
VRSMCDLAKIFLTSKFKLFTIFATPPIKILKVGDDDKCVRNTNNKPPGPIIMIRQSKTGSSSSSKSGHIYYTYFSIRCIASYQHPEQKTTFLSQTRIFWHLIF